MPGKSSAAMSFDHKNLQVVLLAFIALIGLVFVLIQLYEVLLPLVLATLLSLVFKPLVMFLRKHRIPMGLCIVIVIVCISAIIFTLSYIATTGIQRLIADAPRYQERLTSLAGDITGALNGVLGRFGKRVDMGTITDGFKLSSVTPVLAASVGSVLTVVTSGVLTLLFTVFLLLGSEEFPTKLRRAFSTRQSEKMSEIIALIHRDIRQYILTKTLINLIVAGGTVVVLLIFGVDFTLLTGVLTFFLNYIPNIGAVVAAVIPAIICLLQFDSPGTMFIVVALLVVYHNVIGNLIEPKMMGTRLNLSPLVVLLSLIFWGWVWGPWGMVLAVPIASIIKIVSEHVETLHPVSVLMSTSKEKAAKP